MAGNDIGSVSSVNGNSTSLNNQSGTGGQKPSAKGGNANPGGTKPPRAGEGPVPMPR